MDDLVDCLMGQQSIPNSGVVLTFDDGYRSNVEENLPVLKEMQLPCTGFLTAGLVGTEQVFWWDQLAYAIRHTREDILILNGNDYSLRNKIHKEKTLARCLALLKKVPEAEKTIQLNNIVEQLGFKKSTIPCDNPLMTWEQVVLMKESGIGLGAHTLDHVILSQCDPDEQKRQIELSKDIIETRARCRVRHFAYPNGRKEDYDFHCKRLLRDCGFDSAVTTEIGTVDLDSDRYALPRKPMTANTTVPVLAMTLSGMMGSIEFEY